jgi:hypothetical protein
MSNPINPIHMPQVAAVEPEFTGPTCSEADLVPGKRLTVNEIIRDGLPEDWHFPGQSDIKSSLDLFPELDMMSGEKFSIGPGEVLEVVRGPQECGDMTVVRLKTVRPTDVDSLERAELKERLAAAIEKRDTDTVEDDPEDLKKGVVPRKAIHEVRINSLQKRIEAAVVKNFEGEVYTCEVLVSCTAVL